MVIVPATKVESVLCFKTTFTKESGLSVLSFFTTPERVIWPDWPKEVSMTNRAAKDRIFLNMSRKAPKTQCVD